LVNTCLKANVKRLCYVSSVAAIGRPVAKVSPAAGPRKEIMVNEEAKWENSPYNSQYAKTKYWAELEVWRGIAEGLNAVIVNPSVVLGVGNWYRSSARIFKYIWEEKPFYTAGMVNYVDARDVAEIIFLLTNSDVSAKRFILNAGNITYQALFNQIADCFHKRRPFLRVGSSLAKLMWRLEWIRSRATGRAPLITRETAQSANAFFRFDNGKICRELNFRFRSIEDTVSWCCAGISELNRK
jgi:dihydroflavonol-4-reductase